MSEIILPQLKSFESVSIKPTEDTIEVPGNIKAFVSGNEVMTGKTNLPHEISHYCFNHKKIKKHENT